MTSSQLLGEVISLTFGSYFDLNCFAYRLFVLCVCLELAGKPLPWIEPKRPLVFECQTVTE